MSPYGIPQTEPLSLLLTRSRRLDRTQAENHLDWELYYFLFENSLFYLTFRKRFQLESHFPVVKLEEYHHGGHKFVKVLYNKKWCGWT